MSTRTLDLRMMAAVTWLVAGVIVSGEILYPRFVVPRLHEWHAMPMYWWLIVSLPVVVAAIACGACLVHDGKLVMTAVLAAMAVEAVGLVAAMLYWLGFGKGLDVPLSWIIGLGAVRVVLVGASFSALLFVGRMARRPAAAGRRTRFRGSVHH